MLGGLDCCFGLDGWIGYKIEMSLIPKSVEAMTLVPDKFFGCLNVTASAGVWVYKQKSLAVRTFRPEIGSLTIGSAYQYK